MTRLKKLLQRSFITGLFVLLPIALTVIIIKYLFEKLDGILSPLIKHLIGVHIPGTGLVATLILILLAGIFTKSLIGKLVVNKVDSFIATLPFVKGIYVSIKQLSDAFSPESKKGFKKVVAFEYPRKGVYSLGFVTSSIKISDKEGNSQNIFTVFLPTTPNPTSGYLILIPEKDAKILDISVDDAIKMIISGGLISPLDVLKEVENK
ncbi:MAG: DUF502 domain-containing protein [Acidobacteriota bacterium]